MALKKSDQRYNRFRFDAGSLSLNFVATVRRRGSLLRDLLFASELLSEWFQHTGFINVPVSVSRGNHGDALALREAIHDLALAIISGQELRSNDIELINRISGYPVATPMLNDKGEMVIPEIRNPVRNCLAIIARDAITLLGGRDRNNLKMCNNGTCRMLFLDASPAN